MLPTGAPRPCATVRGLGATFVYSTQRAHFGAVCKHLGPSITRQEGLI